MLLGLQSKILSHIALSRYDFPADSGLAKGSGRSTSATALDDREGTRAETITDSAGNDFSMYSVVTVRFQCDQQITVSLYNL